jgi:hypothetical protein
MAAMTTVAEPVNPLTGRAFTPQEYAFIEQCNRDPVACRNLIAATNGGAMSSEMLMGLGGPTLSTLPTGFGGINGVNFGIPGFSPGLSFLPPLGDAIGGALPTLATIAGQFFLQQQLAKQQEDAAKARLRELQVLAGIQGGGALMLGQNGQQTVVVNPDGTIGMGTAAGGMPLQGPVWPFQPTGTCGPRGSVSVSPADAPAIYKAGCSGALSTRNRFFALRSDGTRDLFVKVGKVQSVAPRTLNRFARKWAKEAGLVASKRGAARGRRRPR